MISTHRDQPNALDLLEDEDRVVLELLDGIEANRGQRVEQRARYGDLVKRLIRQLASREAAAVDVSIGLQRVEGLDGIASRLHAGTAERRQRIDRVERMSRGVLGLSLNTGQEFDPELVALGGVMHEQIRWEISEAIPAIRQQVPEAEQAEIFRSARHLKRHAPTNLDPEGPRWRERARIVSRLLTIFDHLRDFPTAAKRTEGGDLRRAD